MPSLTSTLFIAGSAMSAGGGIMGGFQQKQAGEAEAQQYENNAQLALTRGGAEISAQDARTNAAMSSVRATAAAGGTSPGASGSTQVVNAANANRGILADIYSKYNANAEAESLRYGGKVARWEGNQALMGSLVSGGSTLLTAPFVAKSMGGSKNLQSGFQGWLNS